MLDPPATFGIVLPLLLAFVCGYLAGSVPFGLLIVRWAGAGDIRAIGSGNIGATNVLRTGRKGLALATLVADLLKGAVPVAIAVLLLGPDAGIAAAAGAVLGHCFPAWLGFKGGKGVATAAGVILGLTPLVLLPALLVFVAAVRATRFVSLGSILAAGTAPLAAWATGQPRAALLYVAVAALVVVKHRANIARLLAGTESRLGRP